MRVWDMSLLQDDLPTAKPRVEPYDYVYAEEDRKQIAQRFKKLQGSLTLGLILAFLVPNALLAVFFHGQFTATLNHAAILGLKSLATNQKNALDLYLKARCGNLDNALDSPDFSFPPSQEDMDTSLKRLQGLHEGYVGLGLLDADGKLLAHSSAGAGSAVPACLRGLLTGKSDRMVCDRHPEDGSQRFTVAVRRTLQGQDFVLFASLDPERVAPLLNSTGRGDSVDSALVNARGQYQVFDPGVFSSSPASTAPPSPGKGVDVQTLDRDGEPALVATVWLETAPWALQVIQPLLETRTEVTRARRALYVSGALTLVLCGLLFLTVRKLMKDSRRMAEKGSRLQEMLAHASKMASIGELAAGVAHEINNPLAIIMAESGVIRDMFNPEFELDHSREALEAELDVIDKAAERAKGITKKLQEMGRARVPQSEPCDINQQVQATLDRLKKVELKGRKNLEIQLNLAPDLPQVLADAEPLRQVFGNLILNAADAIGNERGTIAVTTGMDTDSKKLVITIEDSGKGIPPENLERIFHPFFTTKGGAYGTGLGLSIAASIVKYLGGVIKVSSMVGKGSTFTVLLPNNFSCPINPKTA